MTTISIVIPTHNSQQWISESLESVRAQTYAREQLETIVVDDGSRDASADVARSFLVRHAMRGRVLVTERTLGVGAAMNLGWQAAAGDWIQFLNGRDVLAPTKIEAQAKLIPQLPDDIGVIFSSWQRLRLAGDQWLLADPVHRPQLPDPVVLELLAPGAARLGASLIRKGVIAAVDGFSEDIAFALDEHLMLRIARMVVSATNHAGLHDVFVEAPSALPLFFEREGPKPLSRQAKAGIARQHLENMLTARALLQLQDMLTPENSDRLAALSSACLRDIRAHDKTAFLRYARQLYEVDPHLAPTAKPRMRPNYAQWLLQLRARLTSHAAALYRAVSQELPALQHRLRRLRYKFAYLLRAVAKLGERGAAACLVTWSTLLRAVAKLGERGAAACLVTWSTKRVEATGAVIAVVALLAGVLALGLPAGRSSPAGLAAPAEPAKARSEAAPVIVVASTIYAEPSSPWPMPVEVGPPSRVPREGVLQISGLPPAVTLSEGHRVSDGVWAVPVSGLANLEIQIPAGASGRSELALTLIGADNGALAEAQTAIAISVPTDQVRASAAASLAPLGLLTSGAQAEKPGDVPKVLAPVPGDPPVREARAPLAPPVAFLVAPLVAPVVPAPPGAAAAEAAAEKPGDVPKVLAPTPGDPPVREARALPTANAEAASATLSARTDKAPEATARPREVAPSPGVTATPAPAQHAAPRADAVAPSGGEAKTASAVVPFPPRPETPRPQTSAPQPPAAGANATPRADGQAGKQQDQRGIANLIARGERELEDGNVAMARQFFMRAAEASLARGALLLATTYDAHEFARLRVQGVQPNATMARMWYKRARELGASEAEARLVRLGD